MIHWRRLLAVARKERLQLQRDWHSLALAFGLPLFLLVVFGYAITWDVKNIATGILDQDRSLRSRELTAALSSAGYFTVVRTLANPAEIDALLDRGEVLVVVHIPPGFSADLD